MEFLRRDSGEKREQQSEPVTAVIVDNDEMVREGFRLLLERIGISVIGTAANGRDGIFAIGDLQPKLALIDIQLPIRSGIDVAAEIHTQHPAIGLILLTAQVYPDNIAPSFKAGVSGYVFKGGPMAELELAVSAVTNGLLFISPTITSEVLTGYLNGTRKDQSEPERLTMRERSVLQLVAEGATNKEIAVRLGLSPRTVEKHRYRLMKRFKLRSTADLVLFAVNRDLIDASKQQKEKRRAS